MTYSQTDKFTTALSAGCWFTTAVRRQVACLCIHHYRGHCCEPVHTNEGMFAVTNYVYLKGNLVRISLPMLKMKYFFFNTKRTPAKFVYTEMDQRTIVPALKPMRFQTALQLARSMACGYKSCKSTSVIFYNTFTSLYMHFLKFSL